MSALPSLETASFAIAAQHDELNYKRYSVESFPGPSGVNTVDPALLTSVYIIPDYANPRLHKENISTSGEEADIALTTVQPYLDNMVDGQSVLNLGEVRQMS